VIHYKFNCPHCGQKLEAAEDMLGTTMDCPSCNGKFTVPMPEPAPLPCPQKPSPHHIQKKQAVETNVKQGALSLRKALSIRTANELIFALCRQQHRSSTERRYRDVISKKRMSKDRTYKLRFPAGAGYGKVG